MYRNHYRRILGILIFTIIVFFCYKSQVVGFNLSEQIVSKFQTYFDQDFSNEEFSTIYSSNFSKDPFGDAMSSIEGRTKQLEVAGAQYVEQLLQQKGCKLSKKEIWGMLYYFVPEFRTELAMNLKQQYGDYNSNKYVFTGGKIAEYCGKYFACEKSVEVYTSLICENEKKLYDQCVLNCQKRGFVERLACCKDESQKYEECLHEGKEEKITASTAKDVETSCKEFFTKTYNDGRDNKKTLQNVEVVQIGVDKYWNNTVDDSPYDIMSDLSILAKLLYYGVEDPITPIMYKIPTFSNSKKKLAERKNENSQSERSLSDGGGGGIPGSEGNFYTMDEGGSLNSKNGGEGVSLIGGNVLNQDIRPEEDGGYSKNIEVSPYAYEKNGGFDDLVEGLNVLKLENNGTEFYSSLCKEQDDSEIEQENFKKRDDQNVGDVPNFSDLSDEEYQEIIDFMLDAVDDYLELPEDKEKEIQQNVGNINNMIDATKPSDLEKTADQIKNCWKSCEGLRIDQRASCMLKCACGEIKSPVFNPEKTPGLGPIFLIRFCAIPAVNTKFSVGGKRIHSIEEGLNEIYGVVDKLSREGNLGKWTQQYEFLDSSTKKINIADTFAFSIDVDFVDITNKKTIHSNQYEEKRLKDFNQGVLEVYGISNPLNNSSAKNAYRIDRNGVDWGLKTMVDLIENSKANRYSMNEETFSNWMDQQANLRKKMSEDFSDWTEYANTLKMKKG